MAKEKTEKFSSIISREMGDDVILLEDLKRFLLNRTDGGSKHLAEVVDEILEYDE